MTEDLADLRAVLLHEWRLQRARSGFFRAALWMVPLWGPAHRGSGVDGVEGSVIRGGQELRRLVSMYGLGWVLRAALDLEMVRAEARGRK